MRRKLSKKQLETIERMKEVRKKDSLYLRSKIEERIQLIENKIKEHEEQFKQLQRLLIFEKGKLQALKDILK